MPPSRPPLWPWLWTALFVGVALAGRVGSAQAQTDVRFGLFVGNDLGGPGTSPLLYARQDARRMRDVLLRLGNLRDENTILLLGQDAAAFRQAVDALELRLRAAEARQERTTLIVYYSGHAKDGELRLGASRLPMDELRSRVSRSHATLKLALVDACHAGGFTRTKGARKAPAFEVEATSAAQASGTVLLTSSSFDEDAQESDHIGGSYFSHHFVSGLQGAADRSGDGKVTLAEAYAHAYARTVASTAESAAGPQHPTFRYELEGNGDFVLSDYTQRREGLRLPAAAPAGTYFLVDDRGVVAAELDKAANQERRVSVAPGVYKVKRRLADRLRVGQVRVVPGELAVLDEGRLHDTPFADDPVKGVARDLPGHFALSVGATSQAFFEKPTRESLFPPSGLLAAELTMSNFLRHDWVLGFDLAVGGGQGSVEDVAGGLSFETRQVNLGASLWAEWPWRDGDLAPFFGARMAFVFLDRRFEDEGLPAQFFSTFSPGLVGGLRYRLSRHMALLGRGRVHYLLYNVDQNRSLGFAELTLALGYDF